MSEHEDYLAERLRRALQEAAEQIQPAGDGLQRIRARTRARERLGWLTPLAIVTATAAVTGIAAGGVMTMVERQEDTGTAVPAQTALPTSPGSPSATPHPPGPAPGGAKPLPPAPSPTAPPTRPVQPGAPITVPVYYVGEAPPGGLRLYREFRRVPAYGDPVTTAVHAMLGMRPLDPDYRSYWPSGTGVRSVTRSGDTVTVDLTREAAGLGSAQAEICLQQLAYTVTAAAQSADLRIRLLVDGQPARMSGLDGTGAVERADPNQVQAAVWIIDPQEGDTVGTRVRLKGVANTFEANVRIQVLAGDQVVVDTYTTATAGTGTFGTWVKEIDLKPGAYVVKAFEESAEDGSVLWPDTKRITVR